MDDQVLTKPVVNTQITDGEAIIEGSMSFEEANKIASIIQSGALPVTLRTISVNKVGPTLGAESLPNTIKAGLIGFIFILIIMFIRYRFPGILSVFSLAIYMILFFICICTYRCCFNIARYSGYITNFGNGY